MDPDPELQKIRSCIRIWNNHSGSATLVYTVYMSNQISGLWWALVANNKALTWDNLHRGGTKTGPPDRHQVKDKMWGDSGSRQMIRESKVTVVLFR